MGREESHVLARARGRRCEGLEELRNASRRVYNHCTLQLRYPLLFFPRSILEDLCFVPRSSTLSLPSPTWSLQEKFGTKHSFRHHVHTVIKTPSLHAQNANPALIPSSTVRCEVLYISSSPCPPSVGISKCTVTPSALVTVTAITLGCLWCRITAPPILCLSCTSVLELGSATGSPPLEGVRSVTQSW